jgi:hypothetical protein
MEIWKPVKDYEGYYEISNLGRVKSLSRIILKNGLHPFKSKEKIIKTRLNNYHYVTLCKNKTYINFYIHRLVAISFLPNIQNKKCVNHINGIKTDNRVENLEWVTYKENTKHAINIGLINQNGENSKNSKLNKEKVLEILNSNLLHKELSEKYNISKSYVSTIKRKITWKHI